MTTEVRTQLICSCGHKGLILMRENDAPFTRQHESYSVIDLIGENFYVDGRSANWKEVFREMKPKCPHCGSELTEHNIEN